jgi:hypothetical protein
MQPEISGYKAGGCEAGASAAIVRSKAVPVRSGEWAGGRAGSGAFGKHDGRLAARDVFKRRPLLDVLGQMDVLVREDT